PAALNRRATPVCSPQLRRMRPPAQRVRASTKCDISDANISFSSDHDLPTGDAEYGAYRSFNSVHYATSVMTGRKRAMSATLAPINDVGLSTLSSVMTFSAMHAFSPKMADDIFAIKYP
ncbi:hypothetical protein, partial [Sphingomonas sp. UYAg733]